MAPELPPRAWLEVTAENWHELHALGFRHFLNVTPAKLTEAEFLDLVALAKSAAGGEEHFAFGVFYDELCGPLERRGDIGLYVRRPEGWLPV
jgi:hypothetical protein